MLEDVGSQRGEAGRRAVHGVDHGDRLLDAVPLHVVESDGRLVGGLVQLVLGDLAGELDRNEPGLEVDLHGGAVVDGPGEVVGVDHIPEDLAGVPVGEGDRGAGEGDERRVGQCVADVPGVAVEVVVVTAVRLVDNHDDVATGGQQRMVEACLAFLVGEAELLQRREVDPAGGAVGQLSPELTASNDLLRAFSEQP